MYRWIPLVVYSLEISVDSYYRVLVCDLLVGTVNRVYVPAKSQPLPVALHVLVAALNHWTSKGSARIHLFWFN